MTGHSTISSPRRKTAKKPSKPRPDFPLFPHASKRWAKKILGKFHYFGPWTDDEDRGADAALERYLEDKDHLYAGRRPPKQFDALTVRQLCNEFLTAKRDLLGNCEITERTFRDYYVTCEQVLAVLDRDCPVDDLDVDDFKKLRKVLAEGRGPVALGNAISRVRMIFKYGFDQGKIERPVRYGQTFNKPSKKTLRKARAANGERMYDAEQLRKMIGAAGVPLKAMILLGINCGFGQSDVANLPKSAIDFGNGWIDYPRQKTGVERRCPLWPETIDALRDAIEQRPRPKEEWDEELAFLTKYGNPWVRTNHSEDDKKRGMSIDSVAQECRKLLEDLGMKRGRLNFYALRHTFQTIGEETAGDHVAVKAIMGHVDDSMSAVYRERVSDARLKLVTDAIRAWLFPTKAEPNGGDVE